MIENKDFPDIWAEGLCSALFKSGSRLWVDNYRDITILGVFEIAVNNCLCFVNDAFEKNDVYNGGLQRGSRNSVNIFILNGLVQRQLSIGNSQYLCYVDFSKAFDMINRHIPLYKIMNSGWYGNVIDTMLN